MGHLANSLHQMSGVRPLARCPTYLAVDVTRCRVSRMLAQQQPTTSFVIRELHLEPLLYLVVPIAEEILLTGKPRLAEESPQSSAWPVNQKPRALHLSICPTHQLQIRERLT